MGGWDPMSYLLFLSYGYLIFSNTKIRETIKKYSPIYLAVAIIPNSTVIGLAFWFYLKYPWIDQI